MPVAKKKTMSAHPPTKSTGKRQPTGTTHFQFRPNQFGRGMGGGNGAGSMNEAEARRPHLKRPDGSAVAHANCRASVSDAGLILIRRFTETPYNYRGSDCSALAKAYAATATTAAFSCNSRGTILSSVSAGV